MATKSTIRTRILALAANHAMVTSTNVDTLLDTDHEEILEAHSWTRRKAEGLITTVAPYSTGTVSGSASSTTLTGASTVWTSSMANRFIRIGSGVFYLKISSVESNTSLTLEAALPAAVSASTTYSIFQHVYALPSDFGRLTSITSDSRLVESSQEDLDRLDPYRNATSTYPERYSIRGLDTSSNYEIEFYPVPSSATIIRFDYLKTNSLASSDSSSPLYPSEVLIWKSAESAACFLFARTGDQAWTVLADRYHLRYQEALANAVETDLLRYSPAGHVRDSTTDGSVSDDFNLDHDVGFL